MRGWVYILSNKAMPGLLKIGFTLKDPALRARELEKTGVPHPFDLDYEVLVSDPRLLEQRIHLRLDHARERKEWFRCKLAEAVAAIQELVSGNAYVENFYGQARESEPDVSPADSCNEPADLLRKPDPPCKKSSMPRGDGMGRELVSIRFTATFSDPCQHCRAPIKVTVTRHDSGTVCPQCHRYNDLAAFISRELPR